MSKPTMGIRVVRRMIDGEVVGEDIPEVTRITFTTPAGQPIEIIPHHDHVEIRNATGKRLDGTFPQPSIERGNNAAENADAGEHS